MHERHAAFCGAAFLSLFAVVFVGGCDGSDTGPGGGNSGGSSGSKPGESGGASQGGATGGRASAGSGGTVSENGGAAATTGGHASTGTGGRSADGGAGHGSGGAPSGSGGAATGGALASGGAGGASEPDAAACKYTVPAVITEGSECTSSVCQSDSGYEIRVSTPGGFYVGHLVWVLVSCDALFYRSAQLNGALTTLRFLLTEDEFQALPDRLPVGVYYGNPGAGTGAQNTSCGTLTLSNPPACSP